MPIPLLIPAIKIAVSLIFMLFPFLKRWIRKGGGFAAAISGAGAFSNNIILTKTNAYISNSEIGDANNTQNRAGNVTLQATNDATIKAIDICRLRSIQQVPPQLTGKRLGKVDMTNLCVVAVINRVLPAPGVIKDLIRNRDLTRVPNIRYDTNRIQSDDGGSASLLQSDQIRAVIYRVWRNRVRLAVPGDRHDTVSMDVVALEDG